MNRKFIAIITALALVVTLLAPVGVQEASARSDNWIDKVVSVTDDAYLGGDVVAPNLVIQNKDKFSWKNDQTFRLTLPGDVDWVEDKSLIERGIVAENFTLKGAQVARISDQIIEVTIKVDPD